MTESQPDPMTEGLGGRFSSVAGPAPYRDLADERSQVSQRTQSGTCRGERHYLFWAIPP
jgi:hypothetical protein